MAKAKYADSNFAERRKFAVRRNDACKELLKYAEKPKTAYDKIDGCIMVDSVLDASNHYMDIHKNDKSKIREEVRFITKYITDYNYCPQYNDVVADLKGRMSKSY